MSKFLSQAVREWQNGQHYDAHETLEDFAEEVEDNDDDWKRALALCHVAAALHKYINNVSPSAVPSKLEKALSELNSAPPDWFDLDLDAFRKEIVVMLSAIKATQKIETFPRLRYLKR